MDFLKGCLTFFLGLLIVILLPLTLTLSSLSSVVFSTTVPNQIIDELDLKEIGQKVAEGLSEGETPQDSLSEESLDSVADNIADSITEEEESQIKTTLKALVSEILSFLKNSDKKEIRVNIKDGKDILLRAAINSPEFGENLGLPKEICNDEITDDCYEQEDIMSIMEKGYIGTLTREDVEVILPICVPGQNLGDCISEEDIDDLLVSNVDRDEDNNERDELLNKFGEDELVLMEEDLPNILVQVRKITTNLNLIYALSIGLTVLFALLILLLNGRNGIIKIGVVGIFCAIIMLAMALLNKVQTDLIESNLAKQPELSKVDITTEIMDAVSSYMDLLVKQFAAKGLIVLGFSLLLLIGNFALSKIKTKEKVKTSEK